MLRVAWLRLHDMFPYANQRFAHVTNVIDRRDGFFFIISKPNSTF